MLGDRLQGGGVLQVLGLWTVLAVDNSDVIQTRGPGVVVVAEPLLVVPGVVQGHVVLPRLQTREDRVLGGEGRLELILRQVAVDALD